MNILIIFLLNLLISTLSQLKYILSAKSRDWKLYLIIGIDTLVYLYSLQLILSKSTWVAMVSLTIGKLLGITVAGYIEDKIVKKTYSFNYYFSEREIVDDLEKELYKQNISITTLIGVSNGNPRYIVNVQVNKQQAEFIFSYLERKWKITEPTADCIEVKKTYGKIRKRVEY